MHLIIIRWHLNQNHLERKKFFSKKHQHSAEMSLLGNENCRNKIGLSASSIHKYAYNRMAYTYQHSQLSQSYPKNLPKTLNFYYAISILYNWSVRVPLLAHEALVRVSIFGYMLWHFISFLIAVLFFCRCYSLVLGVFVPSRLPHRLSLTSPSPVFHSFSFVYAFKRMWMVPARKTRSDKWARYKITIMIGPSRSVWLHSYIITLYGWMSAIWV